MKKKVNKLVSNPPVVFLRAKIRKSLKVETAKRQTPNQTEHVWTYELGTQFLLDLETINGPEKDHYEVTKVRGTNIPGVKKQNIAIYLNLDEQDKMSILLVSKKK